MALKKLSELHLMNSLNSKTYNSIINTLKDSTIVDRFAVKQIAIQDQIATIQRRYKYISKNKVLDDFESGNTKLVFDEKMTVPSFVPAWLTIYNKKVVAVGNLSLYAKENNSLLDIDTKKLFGIMQSASILSGIYHKENKILNNHNMMKNLAQAYSRLFIRVLDRQFSLNLHPNQADKAAYLIGKFFILNLMDKKANKSIDDIAFSCCRNDITRNLIDRIEDEYEIDYTSLTKFVESLSGSIEELQLLTLKSITEGWISMYGAGMILGLESFNYFLVNLMAVSSSSMLNNETLINNLITKQIQKVYMEFFRIIS